MSGDASDRAASESKRSFFRPADKVARLSPDAAKREGQIVRFAIAELGSDDAQSFLNENDEALDGRPLDIATGSDHGSDTVRQAIILKASRFRLGK